jgi:hypothetical protein
MMTRPASTPVNSTHGTNVRQKELSSPARRSRKRARKMVSASFVTSDGWKVKPPGRRIQRRAPFTGWKAKTDTSSTADSASNP